ncbi:MAG: hypothetical protein OSJ36_03615 [Odoribacter sp.]|nr:hypothetical protein [Odoribacter sp.]
MLRIVFFIWCGLLLGACRSEMHPEIYVRIAGAKKDIPTTLCIGGREFSITLDSVGSAVFVLPALPGLSEGELRHGVYRLPLLIEPDRGFEVYMSLLPDDFGAEFTGAGALKNEIWNGKYFRSFTDSLYGLEEEAFLAFTKESREADRRMLDSLGKNESFTALMEKKAGLSVLERLVRYPERHAGMTGKPDFLPSESYRSYVEEYFKEQEMASKQETYRQLLTEWTDMCIARKLPGGDSFREFLIRIGYADTSFQQPVEQQ